MVSFFFYFDHVARLAEGLARLARWLQCGALRVALDIAKDFDAAPEAALFQVTGGNAGRKLVRVSGASLGPEPSR
jgi:NADPH-dependent curcumin reductase CurA